jgi:hypothetical protein
VSSPIVHFSFPHSWQAEILTGRPMILPPRHYVYPREAEEVERGALEILIRPDGAEAEPFLATCALGFRDPAVPSGLWSTPRPQEICAVSGGYAYLIDATAPEHFTMITYRPVLQVLPVPDIHPAPASGVLLFVGHRSILAWGRDGQAWESGKLSDEGLSITSIEQGILRGLGWEMISDAERPFALDLNSGCTL